MYSYQSPFPDILEGLVMQKNIDFYFDFLSPFAYLAHRPLVKIAQRRGYAISYEPIAD